MYLHRIIENHATATSPGLITHKEWPISSFFHDLSSAVAEEMKLALWLQHYDTPGLLSNWLRLIMNSPVYSTPTLPLIIHLEGQTLTYRLDHHGLKGRS